MIYPHIAKEIIALKSEDIELRETLIKKGQLDEGYNSEMANLHNKNAASLQVIINTIGYPTNDKVGEEASSAAWLIIQHSIGQLAFMIMCLDLLTSEVSRGQANPIDLAYLTDRIAIFEGRGQFYGTQFDWDKNGELSPQLCDDLTKVNQRRKSLGLNTLEEQTEVIRSRTKFENQKPPKDLEQQREEYEKWRKEVGWAS